MDDEAFEALKRRVAMLAIKADEATAQAATATEELLAELDRRAAGENATVHEIRPSLRPGDDGA
jgi:hypothetical protein